MASSVKPSHLSTGKKKGIFFGWWIVVGGVLAFALNSSLYFYGFSAFFLPLAQQFGVGRAALSGAFSLARLESGFFGPIEGYMVDRFGPRKLMLIGVAIFGFGFIVLSQVETLWQFYVVFILLITLGTSIGFSSPILTTVANWFVQKRSLAMGIVSSGVGVGGLIIPVLGWLIVNLGWRPTAVIVGLTIWAFGMPLALVMRHRPEQYGYLPDGAVAASNEPVEEERSLTPKEALRSSAFWLLSFSFGLRVMVTGALAIHLIPFLVDRGIRPELAALALGSVATTSVLGRLGFGWLGDRWEKRYMIALLLVVMAISMLVIATTTRTWQIFLFVALYAPSYGGLAAMMHAIRGDYFGRRNFGTIMGMMSVVTTLGTIAGPLFAGYVFDVTGSYQQAFLVFAATTIIAVFLVLLARQPRFPAKGLAPADTESLPLRAR